MCAQACAYGSLFGRVRACAREIIKAKIGVKMLTKVDGLNHSGHYPAVKGKKRKLAEMLVNPENEMCVTELCKSVGVSRQTFYNWMHDMDFRGYLDYLIETYTDSELANVWKSLIRNATVKGKTDAQKLYFELKDKYKQNVNVNGAVIIVDDLNSGSGK